MTNTKKSYLKVSIIAFIIIFSILLMLLLIGSDNHGVYAENINESEIVLKCRDMTKAQTFEIDNQIKDIDDYPYYLMERFQFENRFNGAKNVADEWILHIVPIELFQQKKEFFYIGKAYGFYINYDSNTETYLIYLMKNDISFNNGMLRREIRPLYYEQYVFNEDTQTVSLVYRDYYETKDDITIHFYYYKKYSDYEKLYLKDVNFSGSLYNENHLNIGEYGYQAKEDNGGYFTYSSYRFKGVSPQSGKTDFANALLQIGIGYIPLGTSGLSVGDVLNSLAAISALKNQIANSVNDYRGTVSNEIPYEFFGMERDQQISECGVPFKNIATSFQTENNKDAVLLGIESDSYARNECLINYFNQGDMWNTGYAGSITLDIVKENNIISGSTITEIATDIQTVAPCFYSIDNGEKTQIEEDTDTQIYVLKNTKHKFSFTSPINGRFTLNTNGTVANDIEINPNKIISKTADGNNQIVIFYLKQFETIEFSVLNFNDNGENLIGLKLEFTPETIKKGEEKQVTIAPHETEYFAYDSDQIDALDYRIIADGKVSFDLCHQNRINSKYYVRGEQIFGSYIVGEGKYFIAVANLGDTALPVTVALSETTEIDAEEQKTVEIFDMKVLTINPAYTTGLRIEAEAGNLILIDVYDENNVLVASGNLKLLASIKAGKKYFIQLTSGAYQYSEINLKASWQATSLSIGNRNFGSVSANQMFKFHTPEISAEFNIVSNAEFSVYNGRFEKIGIKSDVVFLLNAEEDYYIITDEEAKNFNIDIEVKYTDALNGVLPESGTVLIRYIPTRTETYIVDGIDSYVWCNELFYIVNDYMYAGKTYYLKINGKAGEKYDLKISINSTQIPIQATININSGKYFFRITEKGTYAFRTFCANEVSSTFDILNEKDMILYSGISADSEPFQTELEPGIYYLDLFVSKQTEVGLQITTDCDTEQGFEILKDSNHTTDLVADKNNIFSFYSKDSDDYCFRISYSSAPIAFNIDILDDDNIKTDYTIVTLPDFSNSNAKLFAIKLNLKANKQYYINVKFSEAKQETVSSIINISIWKQFDEIRINDIVIFKDGKAKNNTKVALGTTYQIKFSYKGNFIESKNNINMWQLDSGSDENLLTLGESSFYVKSVKENENEIVIFNFLDYENIYSVSLILKKPYYVDYSFDEVTYDIKLNFTDYNGQAVNSKAAGFKFMNIKFGNLTVKNVKETTHSIIEMPVLSEKSSLVVSVYFENELNTVILEEREVNNFLIDLADFTGPGKDQRIILSGSANNKDININNNVRAVFIILDNEKFTNLFFNINVSQDCFVYIDGLNITSNSANKPIINSNANNLKLMVNGINSFEGFASGTNLSAVIQAKNITFCGNGELEVKGYDGANGDGGDGYQGGYALQCDGINKNDNCEVTLIGGNGGIGSNGEDAKGSRATGGKGKKGGDAGFGCNISTNVVNIKEGFAGRGGNGGTGGKGAKGRNAFAGPGSSPTTNSIVEATIGGKGGKGGEAGENGKGILNPNHGYPKGGTGGEGGDGGDGYRGQIYSSSNPTTGQPYYITKLLNPAQGGPGGDGGRAPDGKGGDGGRGGTGGKGYNGEENGNEQTYLGGSGGKGGVGGNGGIGKYGNGSTGGNGSQGDKGDDGTQACVAEGTLITLADGSQKAVEDLTGSEQLLVWNLYTGKFETAPILFIDHEPVRAYEVINLTFSDGTTVKVISEHGFFDFDLNEYVFLRKDAAKYIGHWFNKQTTDAAGNMSWTKVRLESVDVRQEYTTAWSPVTYGHLCYYVNGMLSMPGATMGLINIFDVNSETMKIDEEKYAADIAEYGLFTYEEFAALYPVPEVIFEAFGGQYLKVAMGKGLINSETLGKLIARYAKFFA